MTVNEYKDTIIRAVTLYHGYYGGNTESARDEDPLELLAEELWQSHIAKNILKRKYGITTSPNMSLLELIKRIP